MRRRGYFCRGSSYSFLCRNGSVKILAKLAAVKYGISRYREKTLRPHAHKASINKKRWSPEVTSIPLRLSVSRRTMIDKSVTNTGLCALIYTKLPFQNALCHSLRKCAQFVQRFKLFRCSQRFVGLLHIFVQDRYTRDLPECEQSQHRCGIFSPDFFPLLIEFPVRRMVFATGDFVKEKRLTKRKFCKSVINSVAKKLIEKRLNRNFLCTQENTRH